MNDELAELHPAPNIRVLLVDDEPQMLESLEALLKHKNYQVETALGGRLACQKLEQNYYDLVLLDLIMGDFDGFAVMAYMADQSINAAIVVVSGETTFDTVRKALRLGASDYVKKPYAPEELFSTIDLTLHKKYLRVEGLVAMPDISETRRLKEESLLGVRALVGSATFYSALLDSMAEHIVAIDSAGDILFTNHAWTVFANNNEYRECGDWTTVNYLTVCDKAAFAGDDNGLSAGDGIRKVIQGELSAFYLEYPCHSPDEIRWFTMRVAPLDHANMVCYVITHSDITVRKISEEKIEKLSRTDVLTDIPNRRYFDEFLKEEWLRCKRSKSPISLASIDIDYFKLVNDAYGHIVGDDYLQKISALIATYSKRPTDLCARTGGEEFALVLGDTESVSALEIVENILEAVRTLKLTNKDSPDLPIVTVSVGLVTMHPEDNDKQKLLSYSDKLLYEAKAKGRNQVAQVNLPKVVLSEDINL
jgi:diguanylate cyclase (GGDEF)-like protein